MKPLKTDSNDYFISRIYENNILEIEYIVKRLDLYNVSKIDLSVRYLITENFIKYNQKFKIVLNLKNVEFVDSSAIGSTIKAKRDLSKYNDRESLIYCINLNKHVLKTYKLIGLNHTILLMDFDNIEDIIYFENFKMENMS